MLSVMPPDMSWRSVDWANPINWSHPLNRSLVAWYLNVPSQQGNTTWRDLCKRSPGTLTNMAQPPTSTSGPGRTTRRGGWGQLNCDGTNDYVSCGTNTAVQPISAGTISAWVVINTAATSVSTLVSWSNLTTDRNGVTLFYDTTTSALRAEVCSASAATVTAGNSVTALSRDVWNHVAVTWDGANIRLYINSVLLRTTVQTVTSTAGVNPLRLGSEAGTPGFYLNGKLDDIRIATRALSAVEVQALYQRSQRGYPDLLRRWPVRVGHGTASAGAVSFLARPSASQRALLVR